MSLDTEYKMLGGGKEWKMVQEIGNYAKMGMYSDGIEAFVSVRPRKYGITWDYSIRKESKYIDFDILKIFKVLNEKESAIDDRWGGNEIIGGSLAFLCLNNSVKKEKKKFPLYKKSEKT